LALGLNLRARVRKKGTRSPQNQNTQREAEAYRGHTCKDRLKIGMSDERRTREGSTSFGGNWQKIALDEKRSRWKKRKIGEKVQVLVSAKTKQGNLQTLVEWGIAGRSEENEVILGQRSRLSAKL